VTWIASLARDWVWFHIYRCLKFIIHRVPPDHLLLNPPSSTRANFHSEFYEPPPMSSPRVVTSDRTPRSRSMPQISAWHSTMFDRSSMPSPLFVDDQVLLRLTSPRSTLPGPPTNRRKQSRCAAQCRASARLKKKNRAMPVDNLVERLLCS
jgi:hypothetical protein